MRSRGRALGASAAKGNLNRSAITGLLEGFVDAPAFYRDMREELVSLGCKAARDEMKRLSK